MYKQYYLRLIAGFALGGIMVEMMVRSRAGVYEVITLPEQGTDAYILKSRRSKTTTPTNDSGVSSINGTRESSTDRKP